MSDHVKAAPSALAIQDDQTTFTPAQVAVLRHIGVEGASPEDLEIFFHECRRTGLDPFAKQIHMIGRPSRIRRPDGVEAWGKKYTIQTGIDGFRLIGHREADRRGEHIEVPGHEWLNNDGRWIPAWSKGWGMPIAARAVIVRNGHPFVAVAMFDEYAQTKKDNSLTSMWAQRPAGQLAKCAEALAWRMAYPHGLAGIRSDEEMGQADDPVPVASRAGAPRAGMAVLRERATQTPAVDDPGVVVGETAETGEMITDAQRRTLFVMFGDAGFTTDARTLEGRTARLDYMSQVTGRVVESTNELTKREASRIVDALRSDAAQLARTRLEETESADVTVGPEMVEDAAG